MPPRESETAPRAPANEAENSGLPLEGIVVLDFAQFLAAPSCALRLADLGADVIKIERPQGGDLCRQLTIADQVFDGDSALFHTINRNKRSLTADLKKPADLALVKKLIARADVMIHNFRPGVMERLGLGYDEVSALNPRIVYGTVTGYGVGGPWRDKPGQDLLAQSLSGLAWLSGDAEQGPVPVGVSVADIFTGAHLVQGVLAALIRRGATGKGGRVDVNLMASALDLQFEPFTAYLNSKAGQPRRSRVSNANVHAAAPYGVYATADGYMALAMTPIGKLADLLSCEALRPYADQATWYRDRDAIKQVIADLLRTRPTAAWLALLEPADIWCAEVFDWPRLETHPGFAALDAVQEVASSGGETMRTTRCPIQVDGRTLKSKRGAPRLGEHTQEVLAQFGLAGAAGASDDR
ncbi:MAG TPA: CaiB/BaiF CoA-transferase family protein [Roseiarcus sp.]|nr:CaiB/BaiF CoA-transferase family protein [Roseiarcus sp.]